MFSAAVGSQPIRTCQKRLMFMTWKPQVHGMQAAHRDRTVFKTPAETLGDHRFESRLGADYPGLPSTAQRPIIQEG
jgi:hypothetical protein